VTITNLINFWREQAKLPHWLEFPSVIKNANFDQDVVIKWF